MLEYPRILCANILHTRRLPVGTQLRWNVRYKQPSEFPRSEAHATEFFAHLDEDAVGLQVLTSVVKKPLDRCVAHKTMGFGARAFGAGACSLKYDSQLHNLTLV